ncbi:phage portal protein [Chromobacterium haemolyticum]|uniref:phage portal protein n=1 Tax=Chromobacterium haemolyticum TaxID=394935 RepID=UPI004056CC14
MKWLDKILGGAKATATAQPRAEAGTGITFTGLDDPALLEFLRNGLSSMNLQGASSLRNMAVLRCVSLISNGIGMLPVNLLEYGDAKTVVEAHAAHRLIKRKPNDWMTPIELKSLLQLHALLHGNGYARIIWSGDRPIRMIPLNPLRTEPKLTDEWRMVYETTLNNGSKLTLPAKEVFHLRDLSLDGIKGLSRSKLAAEAIQLAISAEKAAGRVFKTGVMATGAIEVPNALSDNAYKRIKESLTDNYGGAENAGNWMVLEENAKANRFSSTAAEAQQIENRNHQIEEIARLYGVPRPLLMMDDTSWGSGVEQLAIFFVQYTLAPWFVAWEQALARVFLTDKELDKLYFKFNERALLRGTLKDQADFFTKALGAGGHAPWMSQNEVRGLSEMPRSPDSSADQLRNPMTQKDKPNEPDQAA